MKKRAPIVLTLALGAVFAFAGGASAHQHYIVTPQGDQVLLPLEPDHVHDTVHPLHHQLHKGKSSDNRAISVESIKPGVNLDPINTK